jgi:hypothetical protein
MVETNEVCEKGLWIWPDMKPWIVNHTVQQHIVTYWVSLVVLHMRSNNVNVAATINSASCYSSVIILNRIRWTEHEVFIK